MAIDARIASGGVNIGGDLPQIANMLREKHQQDLAQGLADAALRQSNPRKLHAGTAAPAISDS